MTDERTQAREAATALGDCWRGVWAEGAPDRSAVGAKYSRSVRLGWRGVLFQAVGRADRESRRASP